MSAGGHTNRDPLLAVTLAFTILASISTCMRIYTRLYIVSVSGADDVLIAVATVSPCSSVLFLAISLLTYNRYLPWL